MQKLYLDCDGVILDTINKSYQILREKGITSEEERRAFYNNVCWRKLIIDSGEIDNSISKIKKLIKHFDVEILTHVYTEGESNANIEYFAKMLPEVNVIAVPKRINKADFVDPTNAILVDDFSPNLEYWDEKGGISVKFSDSGKKCPYIVITDLLQLLEINLKNKIEVKE